MKAVCISGSPRAQGNTVTLLQEVIRALEENAVDVTHFVLSQMDIRFCLGCKACCVTGECPQKDDVQTIMNEVFTSDLVIIASPSYWGDVTAQMKTFIDRCTPYCNTNDARVHKHAHAQGAAIAIRAGQNKAENESLVHTIEHFLGHLGIELLSDFTVEGIDSQKDLQSKPEILEKAYDFGKSLAMQMT